MPGMLKIALLPMGTLQSAEEPLAFVLSSKIKEKLIACFW
jgi:hypothetical protein